jgi:hypothetical protein
MEINYPPENMLVVVDKFNERGQLKDLLQTVPKEINLGKYLTTDLSHQVGESKYKISGLISLDPFHLD